MNFEAISYNFIKVTQGQSNNSLFSCNEQLLEFLAVYTSKLPV